MNEIEENDGSLFTITFGVITIRYLEFIFNKME